MRTGRSFIADIVQAQSGSILWAIVGGAILNVANQLLVGAIDIAGLAVTFPVGIIGIALVVRAISSYLVAPAANVILLFGGIALVLPQLCATRLRIASGSAKKPSRAAAVSSLASSPVF